MPLATLTFNDPVNSSLQVGDAIHYTAMSTVPNSNILVSGSLVDFGIVSSISVDLLIITVIYPNGVVLPAANDYIMFEKNKQVNTSGLKGYYADIKFVNNSRTEAKLFSMGSEVSESSK
jgi:hypothetical protein